MLAFSMFFALCTSRLVTLVQSLILQTRPAPTHYHGRTRLTVCHGVANLPLALYLVSHGVKEQRLGHKVDSPQAGVRVVGVERLEAVTQVSLGAVASQDRRQVGTATHRSVPHTNQRVGHHQCNVVSVIPSTRLHSHRHVC